MYTKSMKNQYICFNVKCRKVVHRYPSRVSNPQRVFCSSVCYGEYLKVEQRGEANPNYQGGLTLRVTCECGRKKDTRAEKCAICSKKSRPREGARVSVEELRHTIPHCSSFLETAQKLNISRKYVREQVAALNIDISHFKPTSSRPRSIEEVLVKGDKRDNAMVRRVLLQNELLPYVCHVCGLEAVWAGKGLVLQLDHINGDGCDNRLENLRFLCPNCHTQTETFTGKNAKKHKERKRKD